jgi:hypothetical protein
MMSRKNKFYDKFFDDLQRIRSGRTTTSTGNRRRRTHITTKGMAQATPRGPGRIAKRNQEAPFGWGGNMVY